MIKIKAISLLLSITLLLILTQVASTLEVYRIDKIYVLKIGQIDKPTYEIFMRTLSNAENNSAVMLILDTPGGRLDIALSMVKSIENSTVPIISYVYPKGAYAWSAGTLILLASHVAVMSPGTTIGSCQPVYINIVTGEYRLVTETKTLNAISKYFEEVARIRNRNSTFARLCVLENLNLGSEEALRYHVIDFTARDVEELIRKLNNSVINNVKYYVSSVKLINVKLSISDQIYSLLSNPLILSILSSIGLILLILGIFTGHVYIAIIGLFLMIIPALTELPSRWLGLLLIIIGSTLLIADLITGMQSHGALSIPGLAVLIIGLLLIQPILNPEVWTVKVNPLIASTILYVSIAVSGVFFMIILHKVIKTVKSRPVSQKLLLNLTGKIGIAIDDIEVNSVGYVKIDGEYWKAKALEKISKGDLVKVLRVENNLLIVVKLRD